MRVLIVDDDRARGSSLLEHLVLCEIVDRNNAILVDCVVQAQQQLKSSYFHVLIIDVVLPRRSGDTPAYDNGISLLSTLQRSTLYKRPERIIGITAYVDDIPSFREKFEQYCFTVIEANPARGDWKSTIADALLYSLSSIDTRAKEEHPLALATVHGIRTFGGWQRRLHSIIARMGGTPDCSSYKYGYFSAFAFLFPPFRYLEVHRLKKHLKTLFDQRSDETKFFLFAHSFGTYLLVMALRSLINEGHRVPVKAVVLCGSVLPERFNWHLFQKTGITFINECADQDYVLYLSKGFAYGLGMAGKTGFYGFNNKLGMNRYYLGGHSSYFDGDDFMMQRWAPLLQEHSALVEVDLRTYSFWRHSILDKAISIIGFVKPFLYLGAIGWLTFSLWV